jgi:hypothetical protein
VLTYYRGHVVVLINDAHLTAEITELSSATPLPTKAVASHSEGAAVCVARARALIDLYIEGGKAADGADAPPPVSGTDTPPA